MNTEDKNWFNIPSDFGFAIFSFKIIIKKELEKLILKIKF